MRSSPSKKPSEPDQSKQKCFDKALDFLARRPHSQRELSAKLRRKSASSTVESVIQDLLRLNYLNDAGFAQTLTASMQRRSFGKRRAMLELLKRGVGREIAEQVLHTAYAATDPMVLARQFATKQMARLRKLNPAVAKRRLFGSLRRRGFDGQTIRAITVEFLKTEDSDPY